MGLACLFMVACNNAPKQQEAKEEAPVIEAKQECPMSLVMGEYANWDNLDEVAKAELNKKALALFTEMDAKMAEGHECNHEGEGKACCKEGEEKSCCKEGEAKQCPAEMTEEQKAECEAKCAEMKAKWDAFETLSVDEQKDLIMCRIECMKKHQGCCKGEGHECQQGK